MAALTWMCTSLLGPGATSQASNKNTGGSARMARRALNMADDKTINSSICARVHCERECMMCVCVALRLCFFSFVVLVSHVSGRLFTCTCIKTLVLMMDCCSSSAYCDALCCQNCGDETNAQKFDSISRRRRNQQAAVARPAFANG